MSLRWPPKDPDETLDYTLSWAKELPRLNDEVFESSWRVEGVDATLLIETDGIHVGQDKTYVWLSGGTAGTTYAVINTIQTSQGRTYERTVNLQVKEK